MQRASFTKLSLEEFVKCVDYVRANRDRLTKQRPTADALAAELAKDLGFTVSYVSVRKIKRASGVDWTPKRHDLDAIRVKSNRVRRTMATKVQLLILAEVLKDFYLRFAEVPPKKLQELMDRLNGIVDDPESEPHLNSVGTGIPGAH